MGNSTSVDNDLINACKAGESNKISKLISDGANINCRDEKSNTPLMWACAQGQTKCVETLLKCKANLEDRDDDGYTALHWAVIQKHPNIVSILIKAKSDLNAKNNQGDTPLHKAVYYGNKKIASLLITNGSQINALNNLKQTPMDKARTKEMKIFLKTFGAENNTKDINIEGININNKNELKKKANLSETDKEFLELNKMKNKVKKFLIDIKLPNNYYDKFINNGYDRMELIIDMTDDEFNDIGILKGHIKLLKKYINEYKNNEKLKVLIEKSNEPGHNNDNNNNNNNEENNNIEEQPGTENEVENNENIEQKNDNNQ